MLITRKQGYKTLGYKTVGANVTSEGQQMRLF